MVKSQSRSKLPYKARALRGLLVAKYGDSPTLAQKKEIRDAICQIKGADWYTLPYVTRYLGQIRRNKRRQQERTQAAAESMAGLNMDLAYVHPIAADNWVITGQEVVASTTNVVFDGQSLEERLTAILLQYIHDNPAL